MKTITQTTNRSRLRATVATAVVCAALISGPAYAQDPQAADDAADEAAPAGGIVVTGSLIRDPNLSQATPVLATTAEEIELRQSNVAEEVLRELPGVTPNIGSAVNNGNGGSSFVDLRGLGANRNIVLLDGGRVVPSGLRGIFDLNNVPLALVERVDVLTGAAVTTYGADAVTGVVNFITKKDFAGLEVSASEAINGKGDGNAVRVDATMGANFDDGRGNAVLSLGYQKTDPVYQGDRDFSVFNVDSFSGSPGGSGTTVPSRFSLSGSNRQINPSTGALQAGFNAFNFNPYNIFQTPFVRYNMFGAANYQVSDAVEVYARGLFSKNSVKTIIAPSGVFASSVTIPISNPFLPATARTQFCSGSLTGVYSASSPVASPAACAAAALATNPSDPNYRTVTTVLRRRFVETGTRNSDFRTTVFDFEAGLRGAITDNIEWDIHGAYGQSENIQTQTGYVLTSKVRDALLATNTSTCLSGNTGCVPLNIFGDAGTITPAMIPYLLAPSTTSVRASLGQVHAQISGNTGLQMPWASDAVSFAVGSEYRKYTSDQLPDNLSQIPGELGGAGGAAPEVHGVYSVWEALGELNMPLVQDKAFFEDLSINAGIRHSSYKVGVGGAGANTTAYDYVFGGTTPNATGNPSFSATTWKIGGSWQPVSGIKFRANYAHAVRAPNIQELFLPFSVGLTSLATDPCAGAAPTTNANLRAICLAQGAPLASIGSIANPTASQANSYSGGFVGMKPEKANTFTVGTVIQPTFVDGFSLSLDYYNIKVSNAITAPTSGDAIAACFTGITAASAANLACTSIRRNPTTGTLDGDPATTRGLFQPVLNLGTLKTNGFDLVVNYKNDFGFAEYSMQFAGNYTMHSTFQSLPKGLNRECVGYYSVNCSFTGSIQPKYQWSMRNSFKFGGGFDVSLLWRHISKVEQEPIDTCGVNRPDTGLPDAACSGAVFVGTIPAGAGALSGQSVDFGHISAHDYFDLAAKVSVSDHLTLVGTVSNLFDKQPPVVGASVGTTSFNSGNTYPSTYDALGRRFSVSAKLKF